MWRTGQKDSTRPSWTGLKHRRSLAGVRALSLLLIVASLAAFLVACGDDPSPTPVPTAATVPDPTATSMPEPTPEPVPTSAKPRSQLRNPLRWTTTP